MNGSRATLSAFFMALTCLASSEAFFFFPGPPGDPGPPGRNGLPGWPGAKGDRGDRGSYGPEGLPGYPGDIGEKGDSGLPGRPGVIGPMGPTGPAGEPGPRGYPGSDGKPGAQGFPGPAGSMGQPGAMGQPGPIGEPGVCDMETIASYVEDKITLGMPAEKGDPGLPGIPGVIGPMGPTGPAGEPGPRGYPGSDGKPGAQGFPGPAGSMGQPGPIGEPGVCDMGTIASYVEDKITSKKTYSSKCSDDLRCTELETEKQEIINAISNSLDNSTNGNEKPRDGTKEAPALTCRELKKTNPSLPSNMYWIDPNGWDPKDAVQVYCNMEQGASCLVTSPNISGVITAPAEQKSSWLADVTGGIQVSYKISRKQLIALQKISDKAMQNITVLSSPVKSRSKRDAVLKSQPVFLLGYNDAIISPTSSNTLRYQSAETSNPPDGAGVQIEISYTTIRTERLPVMDVDLREILTPLNSLTVTFGSICFF